MPLKATAKKEKKREIHRKSQGCKAQGMCSCSGQLGAGWQQGCAGPEQTLQQVDTLLKACKKAVARGRRDFLVKDLLTLLGKTQGRVSLLALAVTWCTCQLFAFLKKKGGKQQIERDGK